MHPSPSFNNYKHMVNLFFSFKEKVYYSILQACVSTKWINKQILGCTFRNAPKATPQTWASMGPACCSCTINYLLV